MFRKIKLNQLKLKNEKLLSIRKNSEI